MWQIDDKFGFCFFYVILRKLLQLFFFPFFSFCGLCFSVFDIKNDDKLSLHVSFGKLKNDNCDQKITHHAVQTKRAFRKEKILIKNKNSIEDGEEKKNRTLDNINFIDYCLLDYDILCCCSFFFYINRQRQIHILSCPSSTNIYFLLFFFFPCLSLFTLLIYCCIYLHIFRHPYGEKKKKKKKCECF